jgi:hypothetical protein
LFGNPAEIPLGNVFCEMYESMIASFISYLVYPHSCKLDEEYSRTYCILYWII